MHGFHIVEKGPILPTRAELNLMDILETYEKMTKDVQIPKDMLDSLYKADRLLSRRSDYWRRVIPDNLVSEKLKEEQDELDRESVTTTNEPTYRSQVWE